MERDILKEKDKVAKELKLRGREEKQVDMGIGFIAKSKNNNTSSEQQQNWGMGFLLVFFPEEDNTIINNNNKKKSNSLFSSSSSSSSPSSSIKRTAGATHLLSRAQSTISICALLIFITLLLFTLSTFEPAASVTSNSRFSPRRQLSQLSSKSHFKQFKKLADSFVLTHALQGMGTLYRRGTRPMNDLVVAHVVESLSVHELKLFLRVLHRSHLTSRADLLIIFPSKSAHFDAAILEENDSFLTLIDQYRQISSNPNSTASFDATQFAKWSKKEKGSGEPIWGKGIRSNVTEGNSTESTRPSYGSVVGFDVDDLDPENSLAGFLDHVPMSLRRWACYPMLFGRVRRNFKHLMLVDMREILLPGDPLSRVRNMSPESVYLSTTTQTASTRHSKKNSDKTQLKLASPAMITGGARGVRRLSNAMLTEIVRTSMQHKKKNSVAELGLFNQLVGNQFLLKNVNLIISTESIPELSSLAVVSSKPGSSPSISNFSVLKHGNSNFDVNSTVMRYILCSSPLYSSVYSDC